MTLVLVGAAGFAASWAGLDVSLSRLTPGVLPHRSADRNRSWAPLPAEVPMPTAAPDDPAAYRGVRFRMPGDYSGDSLPPMEASGQVVPWLRGYTGNLKVATDGSYFGDPLVLDGRRRMKWFVRLVETPWQPADRTSAGPLMAVLDVLVLPEPPPLPPLAVRRPPLNDAGYYQGCLPDNDEALIVGDDGWRFNRSTGRIERIDRDDAVCPED
ncbi:MAG: hypothetical protein LC792_10830 [Actinobacteria bacterium]|nr:hypothetical protein [Actinomycetota bacterium]